jgi:putative sigma-54 modulation protein
LSADKRTPDPTQNEASRPAHRQESSLIYCFTSFKMMTMNVNIQTVHFDADRKLIDFINQKIQKLAMFSDRIIRVNVFLKLDNVMHAIKDKVAEIRVHIPRHSFFVKSTSKSFEESFDDAVDSMIAQIKKNKERKAA